MKSIDIKSTIIGVLLTLTIIFAIGAVPKDTGGFVTETGNHSVAWDNGQQWEVIEQSVFKDISEDAVGYEPFAVHERKLYLRKRIK